MRAHSYLLSTPLGKGNYSLALEIRLLPYNFTFSLLGHVFADGLRIEHLPKVVISSNEGKNQ